LNSGDGQDDLFVPGDSMAVVLAFNPKANPNGPRPTVDTFTLPASHEVAEAATDTRGGPRFSLSTDDPDHPYVDSGTNAGGSPWVRQSGGMELADMSEGALEYEAPPGRSEPFEYERIYSNKASKAGGDPAVPSSPWPYYNVSTDEDWLTAKGGTKVAIPVTAWATADIGDWNVTASISSYKATASPKPCDMFAPDNAVERSQRI
jgi:hypothetical protein